MSQLVPVVDRSAMRHAMGCWTTGVAVITTVDRNGQPHGMTVNSLTSVSWTRRCCWPASPTAPAPPARFWTLAVSPCPSSPPGTSPSPASPTAAKTTSPGYPHLRPPPAPRRARRTRPPRLHPQPAHQRRRPRHRVRRHAAHLPPRWGTPGVPHQPLRRLPTAVTNPSTGTRLSAHRAAEDAAQSRASASWRR